MPGEAIWSLKRQNWSAERAKKCNFRGFLDFSQKRLIGICSVSLQMLSWPFPIIPRARIWWLISMRVTLKNRTVCVRSLRWMKDGGWHGFPSLKLTLLGLIYLSLSPFPSQQSLKTMPASDIPVYLRRVPARQSLFVVHSITSPFENVNFSWTWY